MMGGGGGVSVLKVVSPITIGKCWRIGDIKVLAHRFAVGTAEIGRQNRMYVAIGPPNNKNNIYYIRRYLTARPAGRAVKMLSF